APRRPPPAINGWAGHPAGPARQPQGLLEQLGREAGRRWGQAARAAAVSSRVQADDGVEVDGPAALELGHLGVGDPHELAQLALLEADQAAQGTLDGDGGPPASL